MKGLDVKYASPRGPVRALVLAAAAITGMCAPGAETPHGFSYAGIAADWIGGASLPRVIDDNAHFTRTAREWTSPDGRLTLRSTHTAYKAFPVDEYLPELICRGTNATGIVEDFRSVDSVLPGKSFVLRALKGTKATERDFEAVHYRLGKGGGLDESCALATDEGRSSAEWMPWWHLDFEDGSGLVYAIGWSGAWRADFRADGASLRLTAGMLKTRFRLLPGEVLRQPSVLVFRRDAKTSARAMQTLIHRFMVAEKAPRDAEGNLVRAILPITVGGGNKTPEMMLKVLDWAKRNDLPFDCLWVDAGWNGPAHSPDLVSNCGNMWWHFVGNWNFNPTVHPDGNLEKVSEAAHAAGMRFLLWVEPERCRVGSRSELLKAHREYFLPRREEGKDDPDVLNLNLGDPAACDSVIETISRLVRENDLDIYRQDFNLNPLPIWQGNDGPERQGVTEAKYVAGLYRLWDTLRRRFPKLLIDNCASGGRRLDFEAVSRSHSYCRTDYAIGLGGPSQITDVQNATLNILPYQPFQGSETRPAHFFDDYGFFSSVGPGSVFTPSDWNAGIVRNPFTDEQTAWFKETFVAADRMRPFFEGDFYPLVDVEPPHPLPDWYFRRTSLPDERRWCAYQMHRPDLDAGFVLAFRRLDAEEHALDVELGGIREDGAYEVETYHGATESVSGGDLRRRRIELRSPRSFRLFFYRLKGQSDQKAKCKKKG